MSFTMYSYFYDESMHSAFFKQRCNIKKEGELDVGKANLLNILQAI